MPEPITVSQLTDLIKSKLEDGNFKSIEVSGEISNCTLHNSGHIYFTLKDEESQIKCVMFRANCRNLEFTPEHGKKIVVKGSITVYKSGGNYQINVTSIKLKGLGDLHEKFLKLKEKLKNEGLFDSAHKISIPKFPKKIIIITSETGAVLHDIKTNIKRRYPPVELVLIPTLVQGVAAAESIMKSLEKADAMAADLIIMGRGGGSLEDLWCFNEESVARKIFACDTPIISCVGHETDFTIADFVADVRAPTPSTAAEFAVPDRLELLSDINHTLLTIKNTVSNHIMDLMQEIDAVESNINREAKHTVETISGKLNASEQKLIALDPLKVFGRGYSVTLKDNLPITASQLNKEDVIITVFKDGKTKSKVL
ncbi:MAG: exodeoxyribonuclease VII large subunit [archaeon]